MQCPLSPFRLAFLGSLPSGGNALAGSRNFSCCQLAISLQRQGRCCCPDTSGPAPCRERSSNTLAGSSPGSVTAASRQSSTKGSKMTQQQRGALLQEVDRDLHRQVYRLIMQHT